MKLPVLRLSHAVALGALAFGLAACSADCHCPPPRAASSTVVSPSPGGSTTTIYTPAD